MTAFARESRIHMEARGGYDKSPGDRLFSESAYEVFSLGMLYQTGQLALAAANAALRINKDGIHGISSSNYSAFARYQILKAVVLKYTPCNKYCQ